MTELRRNALELLKRMSDDTGCDELEGYKENDKDYDDFPIGILFEYADQEKRALEKGAFERAMVEKHDNWRFL